VPAYDASNYGYRSEQAGSLLRWTGPQPQSEGFGEEVQASHPDRHLCPVRPAYMDAYYKKAQRVRT